MSPEKTPGREPTANDHAKRADASANSAKTHADRAAAAASRLEEEVKKIDKDRVRHLGIAVIQATVNFFLFVVISFQWGEMRSQSANVSASVALTKSQVELTEQQMEITNDQLALTREQFDLARADTRIALLQQEFIDGKPIEDKIDNPTGILRLLYEADRNCTLHPPLTAADKQSFDKLTNDVLGHYQKYYVMTDALRAGSDWQTICDSAHRLMNQYCHLEEGISALLTQVSQPFREAFEQCELPDRSE